MPYSGLYLDRRPAEWAAARHYLHEPDEHRDVFRGIEWLATGGIGGRTLIETLNPPRGRQAEQGAIPGNCDGDFASQSAPRMSVASAAAVEEAKRIHSNKRRSLHICVRIDSTLQPNRVTLDIPTSCSVVIAEVVVVFSATQPAGSATLQESQVPGAASTPWPS